MNFIRVYICEENHISSVTRFPNAEGVRRCFWCPKKIDASFVRVLP